MRLRNLAAEELVALRSEMTRLVAERAGFKKDLLSLAEQISTQRGETERVTERLTADLDTAKEELARAQAELHEAKDLAARQQAHIAGLKKQNARPARLLAKKTLRRLGVGGSGNAA